MGDLKSSGWNGSLFHGPVADYSPYCRKNTIKSTFSAEILKMYFYAFYVTENGIWLQVSLTFFKYCIHKEFFNL